MRERGGGETETERLRLRDYAQTHIDHMHERPAHKYGCTHQLKSHLGQVAATQIYGTVEYIQSQESLPLQVSTGFVFL